MGALGKEARGLGGGWRLGATWHLDRWVSRRRGPDLRVQSLQEGPEMAARVETEPGCEGAA